jgi:hypothetical protein
MKRKLTTMKEIEEFKETHRNCGCALESAIRTIEAMLPFVKQYSYWKEREGDLKAKKLLKQMEAL